MIISHTREYVYIGIPRTGSKSMNRWLMDHFEGEWFGYHHQWRVPEEARNYLIFTIVRNPYEREVSGWFHIPWSAEHETPPKPTSLFAKEKRKAIPLKDGTVRIEQHNVPEVGMNQKNYVEKAGVQGDMFGFFRNRFKQR
ncbi:MAG: sulfotransferase family 2 domain-containing protein [Anaerolineales bacterium]